MYKTIFAMTSNRQTFRPQMSLYIPSVTNATNEEQIKRMFRILDLGIVSRVDFVEKDSGNSMAFVHFEYWMINNSSYHLQERILTEGQAKIVYNDPYYWIVMENKNPRSQAEIELENRIHFLEGKVKYLETVISTHTRKLIDNGIVTNGKTCSYCWVVYSDDNNTGDCPACDYKENELVINASTSSPGEGKVNETMAEADADALAMTGALGSGAFGSPPEFDHELTPVGSKTSSVSLSEVAQDQNGGWWPFS